MADRVELAFRRAAQKLLPRGSTVVAAVSGGGDSVALLHLMVRYAAGQPLRITVAHLDHALRRGSAGDRRFVERMAARLGLPCISDRRSVASLKRKGESPEEAARRVRRQFLLEAARSARAGLIVMGHTLDDQAETVLLRLVRGAGPAALAGMASTGPGAFVRPLLQIERLELRAYLRRRRIASLQDPSNEDVRFDRNRVRRLVLPFLTATLNPRAARHLVEAAERLREDALYLDELARQTLEPLARRRGGALSFPTEVFSDAPAPLARRMARLALQHAGADPRRITSRHVEALLHLVRSRGAKTLDLPSGLRAVHSGTRLLLR